MWRPMNAILMALYTFKLTLYFYISLALWWKVHRTVGVSIEVSMRLAVQHNEINNHQILKRVLTSKIILMLHCHWGSKDNLEKNYIQFDWQNGKQVGDVV